MFQYATTFNQDISGWDVSNVTIMKDMSRGAGLSTGNYDKLLASWPARNLKTGVLFHAGSSKYTPNSVASEGREKLTNSTGNGGDGGDGAGTFNQTGGEATAGVEPGTITVD